MVMQSGAREDIKRNNPKLVEMFETAVRGLVEKNSGEPADRGLQRVSAQDAEFIPGSYSIGISTLDILDKGTPATVDAVGKAIEKLSEVSSLESYVDSKSYTTGLKGRNSEMVTKGLQELGRNLDQLELPAQYHEAAKAAYTESQRSQGAQRG